MRRTVASLRDRLCVDTGYAFATAGIIAGMAITAIKSHAGRDRRVMVSASFRASRLITAKGGPPACPRFAKKRRKKGSNDG
jgi:hypothetical protein